jgi:hypothetical protein
VKDNANEIEKVDKSVDQLRKELDKVKEANKEEARNYVTAEEYREREARRLNVIMHRVPEPQAQSGEEQKQADLATLKTIFNVIGLSEWVGGVKLCRRLGERGDEPRPLVVYLRDEATRSMLLESARHLRSTAYTEVSIVPDLTQAQRQEEAELSTEMERRNKDELTNEDLQKNLKWQIVGPRGARRLIKTVTREWQHGRGRGRGQPHTGGPRGRAAPSAAAARLRAPHVPPPGRGHPTIRPPNLLPPPAARSAQQKRPRTRDEMDETGAAEDERAEEDETEDETTRSPASKR